MTGAEAGSLAPERRHQLGDWFGEIRVAGERFQSRLLCPGKTRRQRDVIAHPQRLEPSILGGAGPPGENVGCDPLPPMQAKQPELHSIPPILTESTGSHTHTRHMARLDRGYSPAPLGITTYRARSHAPPSTPERHLGVRLVIRS